MPLDTVMNMLLWNNCSSDTQEDGVRVYRVELHCSVFIIRAELLSTMAPYGQYRIISVEPED